MNPDERLTASLARPLRNARSTARPVLFKTGIPDAPISTWGTCFLVGLQRRVFALTAAHVVGDASSDQVLISPAEGSSHWLALSNGFRMIGETDDDLSEYDLLAYEVDFRRLPVSLASRTRVLELDRAGLSNWREHCYTSTWFLFGYPQESNEVDFDREAVKAAQALLAGRYAGMSDLQHSIHAIDVQNPLGFASFSGFSGSPVMAVEERFCSSPVMRFCGIAISGSAQSGRVHVLEAEAVFDLLQITMERTDKFGLQTLLGWS